MWARTYTVSELHRAAAIWDVDIDIHLLGEYIDPEECIDRAHRVIETTLYPGTYHFVLDSWVDGTNTERSGEYLFSILSCSDGDSNCNP